jgi:hypothetical protein
MEASVAAKVEELKAAATTTTTVTKWLLIKI